MSDIEIRPVRRDERDQWEKLFRAYADFYQTELTLAGIEQVWTWIHDEAEPYHAFLACRDAQALGLAQVQAMHRSLSGGMVCYLSDLFTTPEARGAGVGRALIDHCRSFAAGQGMGNLRWLTAEDNAAARRLYDSYAPRTPFILYSIPSRQAD